MRRSRLGIPIRGEMILQNENLTFESGVKGTVRLTINWPKVDIVALWVELTCTVSCWNAEPTAKIFNPAHKVGRYWNFRRFLIGDNELRSRPQDILVQGEYEFKLNLRFRGEEIVLPPTFRTSLGQIRHYVVLSCKSLQCQHQTLAFKRVNAVTGYHNLHRAHRGEQLEKPLRLTKSVWSICGRIASLSLPTTMLTVRMTLPRKGYLPEEQIQGWVVIQNPERFMLEKFEIIVQRRIHYHQSIFRGKEQCLNTVSERFEADQVRNELISKEFSLALPSSLMPTASTKGAFKYIAIRYYVQFVIKVEDVLVKEIRGEQLIRIGTHRN